MLMLTRIVRMKVWWSLHRGETWRERLTSLTTTTSMEEGSGFMKTGKDQDLSPGQEVPALHSLASFAATEAGVVVERRKIPSQAPGQGAAVEQGRNLNHVPRVAVKDQTLRQSVDGMDPSLHPHMILKDLQVNPRDL